jgi:hypothetical protein
MSLWLASAGFAEDCLQIVHSGKVLDTLAMIITTSTDIYAHIVQDVCVDEQINSESPGTAWRRQARTYA